MAEIIESDNPEMSVNIRCAKAVCCGVYRVDGCFALIKVFPEDVRRSEDREGDVTYSVKCPNCAIELYPGWQVGEETLSRMYYAYKSKRQKKSRVQIGEK